MIKEEISLDGTSNRIFVSVIVDDKEIYDMIYNKNAEERMDMIKRSIKIGIMALKNATITVDTNYVQKEVERLICDIDNNLKTNLGKDGFMGRLEKIFGENGYLESNLKERFKDQDKTISDIFRDDNINSPLYKMKRFIEENSKRVDNNIYDMLDPGNKESLLFRLKEDIIKKLEDVKKSGDIDIINKSIENIKVANRSDSEIIKRDIQGFRDDYINKFIEMKKTIHDEIGGVKTMVTDTNIEVAKLVKEKQIIDITTLKGMKFEEALFRFLTTKALTKYGDIVEVSNLGGGELTGDFIINIKGSHEKIVVKAESTSKENVQMSDTIFRHLNNTMKDKNTEFGIKVYENELPEKIGPILISDNKIICSYLRGYVFEGYPLEVAYEILRSDILRKSMGIDRQDVKLHIDNIIRNLNSLQYVSGNLSKMENLCVNTKNSIEDIRKNINIELDQILEKDKEAIKDDIKEKTDIKETRRHKKMKSYT